MGKSPQNASASHTAPTVTTDIKQSDESEKIIEGPSLGDECAKRPFLDGTWFRPDMATSSFQKGVNAVCVTCGLDEDGNPRLIKGSLHSVSNYKSHIKVISFSVF